LTGPGSVSALKNVTIGQIKYLVGDVYPANWYNAGDFGSSNLVNLDVIRVFDFAAYPIAPPPNYTDLFDALDSCGNFGYDSGLGYLTNAAVFPYSTNFPNAVTNYTVNYDTNSMPVSTNESSISDLSANIYMTTYFVSVPYYITNIYVAPPKTNVTETNYTIDITPTVSSLFDATNDTDINQIAFGDGVLDVCDVFVTFRRSLDPNLVWYERYWTNGMRVADTNVVNHPATNQVVSNIAHRTNSVAPLVVFSAPTIYTSGGQTVQVPITAAISDNYTLRYLMLNLYVVPLNGAPALTAPVQFTQTATALGDPYTTESRGDGNYAAVWLNQGNSGITGTNVIGNLSVTIPAGAPVNTAYGVFFDHASASPNGLGSFPVQKVTGTIMITNAP
jgi:hypothetical protein